MCAMSSGRENDQCFESRDVVLGDAVQVCDALTDRPCRCIRAPLDLRRLKSGGKFVDVAADRFELLVTEAQIGRRPLAIETWCVHHCVCCLIGRSGRA